MVTTNFLVKKRKISQIDSVPYTGEDNIDTFKFEFDEEWEGLDKTLVIVSGNNRYNIALLHDQCVVPFEFYQIKGNVLIGLFGTDGTYQTLATGWLPIYVEEDSYEVGVEPDNLPTQTQWDAFVTEINDLLEQAEASEEHCAEILEQIEELKSTIESYMSTIEGYKDTTKGYMDTTEGYKATTKQYMDTTKGYKDDVNTTVTNFNNTVEQKTTDFNNNATQKTDTFNNNATSKTNAFNQNATDKTTAFNNNASSKVTAFNNNYTEKVGIIDGKASDFNTNYENKLGAFNSNASDKTTAFNNNATSKTTDFNTNATSKTTAFNENATSKTGDFNTNATNKTTAFNDNYTAKIADFDSHTAEFTERLDDLEDCMGNETDTFSTDSTYEVGDVVVYGNKFYRCKTAITTAGAWDSTKWEEINVRQEQDEQNEKIAYLQEHVELVESNYNTGVATGSDLDIADALNGYNKGIAVVGNTTQVQSTGKNKLGLTDGTYTQSGVTATVLNNRVTVIGTSTSSSATYIYIPTTEYSVSGNHTLSANNNIAAASGFQLKLQQNTSSAIPNTTLALSSQNASVTFNETATINYLGIRLPAGGTSNFEMSIQLEEGIEATSFEPYTGGQPTPTPTNPSPIIDVTGTQEVAVSNKNILPLTNQNFTVAGINFKVINGKLYVNGTSTAEINVTNNSYKNRFKFILAPGSYTLSLYMPSAQPIAIRAIGGSSDIASVNGTTTTSKTFTISETTECYFGIYIANNKVFSNQLYDVQLERNAETGHAEHKGASALLHLGDIHLRSIPETEYKDRIYYENGKWYLHKEVGSVNLKDLAFAYNSDNNIGYVDAFRTNYNAYRISLNLNNGLCTHFKLGPQTPISTGELMVLSGGQLQTKIDNATSLGDYTLFFNNNNPEFCYQLDTPTDVEITSQNYPELYADLNQLLPTQTYREHTIIQVTPETGNPAQIEIKYLKDDRVADLRSELELLKARVNLLEE